MISKKLKFNIFLLGIILLAIWPVIDLYYNNPLVFNFNSLGRVLGLVGLSIFAIGLILSSRFVWMDKFFSDLTKLLKVHRWLGIISFSFIILHPIFLALALLPGSSQAAWSIFWTWSQPAYVFGYIAILLFMFLVVMTFFWRMKYERLKTLHSLLAIPLMLGGLHGLLIDSDIKANPSLAWYYIILISLGVIAYLTRVFLIDQGLKSKAYLVDEVSQPTTQTVKVVLRPEGRQLKFKSGQFIFISFNDLEVKEEHPFSVAGIGPDGQVTIVAKVLGDFTTKMKKIRTKSLAYIDGPYGSFGQMQTAKTHQIWIAGGIGITPFLSLAEDFVKNHQADAKVDLIYSVAKASDFVDLPKLEKLTLTCPQIKITPHVSEEQGRLDIVKIKKMMDDFDQCVFCLCGPQGMVTSFVKQLKKASVPKSRISIEAFELL